MLKNVLVINMPKKHLVTTILGKQVILILRTDCQNTLQWLKN